MEKQLQVSGQRRRKKRMIFFNHYYYYYYFYLCNSLVMIYIIELQLGSISTLILVLEKLIAFVFSLRKPGHFFLLYKCIAVNKNQATTNLLTSPRFCCEISNHLWECQTKYPRKMVFYFVLFFSPFDFMLELVCCRCTEM